MGQHKSNPKAVAAKNGELPPKKRGPGKREMERAFRESLWHKLFGGMNLFPYQESMFKELGRKSK